MDWNAVWPWAAGIVTFVAFLIALLLFVSGGNGGQRQNNGDNMNNDGRRPWWDRLFGPKRPELHNHLIGDEDTDGAYVGGTFGAKSPVKLAKHVANLTRDPQAQDKCKWYSDDDATEMFRHSNRNDVLAFMLSATHRGKGLPYDPALVPFRDEMTGTAFEAVPGSIKFFTNGSEVLLTDAIDPRDLFLCRNWQEVAALTGNPGAMIEPGKAFVITYRVRRKGLNAIGGGSNLPPGGGNITP